MRKVVFSDGAVETVTGEGAQSPAVDLPGLLARLDRAAGERALMAKVESMLRAGRAPLFSEVGDDHVAGVVRGQRDPTLFFACKIDKEGRYMCCTQNLNVCGGLRGKPCKHLLFLIVALAQTGAADAATLAGWVDEAKGKRPVLDKDAMVGLFVRYKQSTGA